MFTAIKSIYMGNNKCLVQGVCKTADIGAAVDEGGRPTDGIANGSICFNMETSAFSMFDEGAGDWTDLD